MPPRPAPPPSIDGDGDTWPDSVDCQPGVALVSTTTTYCYGFNGVESDAELGGQPHAHFSTLFRQYDPRVARWWSNDPIVHPWESPYAAMAGNPIALADPLGLEGSSPLDPERENDPILLNEIVVNAPMPEWMRYPFRDGSPWEAMLREREQVRMLTPIPMTREQRPEQWSMAAAPTTASTVVRDVRDGLAINANYGLAIGDLEMAIGARLILGLLQTADDIHVFGRSIDYRLGFVSTPPEHLWGGIVNERGRSEAGERTFAFLATAAYGNASCRPTTGVVSRPLPWGFPSHSVFDEVIARVAAAANVDDAMVGIRGSAVTGYSYAEGVPFSATSDLDLFVVSDKLLAQGQAAGAIVSAGQLRVGATRVYFPSLAQIEKALSTELGRKVTVRIYGTSGFNGTVKPEPHIIGR